MKRAPMAAAAIVIAAGVGAGTTVASDDAGGPAALRFAWPRPSRVRVTETALKRGVVAIARYDLLIEPAPDGAIVVRYASFEPITVDGEPLAADTPPELRSAFASLMPRFRIDASGRLAGVVGLDDLLRMHGGGTGSPGAPPTLTPQGRAMLRATVASYWAAWAGAWAGLRLEPGASVERTSDVSLFGARIEQAEVVRHLGASAGHPGKIRLRSETVLDDRVTALVREALDSARQDGGGDDAPLGEGAVAAVTGTATAEVVTDPITLMPVTALREKTIHATLEDGRTVSSLERHRYEFEWRPRAGADAR